MQNNNVSIIAGPCSVDENNIHEIMEISQMTITNSRGKKQKAVKGTRIIGLKSRTELSADGRGIGMDYAAYKENLSKIISGRPKSELAIPPSGKYAIEVFEKTGMLIATEVCSPIVQLLPLSGKIPKEKMLPWNPAVMQLGWPILEMGKIAKDNGWYVGIKNGKWLGESIIRAESSAQSKETPLDKVWSGLHKYTDLPKEKVIMIQRGIEIPAKGDYRSMPIHETAKRVKTKTGCKMYFDPSHSLGPKMRLHIVAATIDALQIKLSDGSYLYDGVLIEVGTSKTDTDQHITLMELQDLCDAIAKFRNLEE